MPGRISQVGWVVRAVLLVAVVAGLARLRFDTEVLGLLPAELDVARGLVLYQRHFTDARQLLVTVDSPDPETTAAAARHLATVFRGQPDRVAAADWQAPWLERPGELAELIAYLWLQAAPDRFSQLASRLSPEGRVEALAEARERLATSLSPEEIARVARDPYGLLTLDANGPSALPGGDAAANPFVSPDGRLRVVFVESAQDLASYPACIGWLGHLRSLVAAEQASGRVPSTVSVRFTGRPVFVAEIAGGMERDMTGSMSGTLATIAVLFWLTHRRWRPLGWLIVALVAVQGLTLALAGLWLGRINVVSLGFGAILFGLAEDFGVVIYQEARSHPGLSVGELRRLVLPGIVWSAVTTAGAFLLLNLSHLPGLSQLGTLVAIGVTVAAGIMVAWYLPRVHAVACSDAAADGGGVSGFRLFSGTPRVSVRGLRAATVGIVSIACLALGIRTPSFDRSPNVLAPRHSEARETLARIRESIGGGRDPLWLLVSGRDDNEVRGRMETLDAELRSAVGRGTVGAYRLPIGLWPDAANAAKNVTNAVVLASQRDAFRTDLERHGFQAGAGELTEAVLAAWERAAGAHDRWLPSGRTAAWIMKQVMARSPDGPIALGIAEPRDGSSDLRTALGQRKIPGVIVAGWELLGAEVFRLALADLPWVLIPVTLVVVVSLAVAYRNWREVGLTLSMLALSGLVLAATLGLLDIRWNLMNLLAIPLMLGMGVDFCIHMQLALRRLEGDAAAVRASVGRALLLAGSTTVAGFASLAFSSNAGLASLGLVCAFGIGITLAVSVYLLPAWWTPRNPGA